MPLLIVATPEFLEQTWSDDYLEIIPLKKGLMDGLLSFMLSFLVPNITGNITTNPEYVEEERKNSRISRLRIFVPLYSAGATYNP